MKLGHWQSGTPTLLPVTVLAQQPCADVVATTSAQPSTGTVEIELCGAVIRLSGQVDAAQLTTVLAALRMIGCQRTRGVDRGRTHRHAQGLRWSGRDGGDRAEREPVQWHVFVFRGRRGDIIKVLWFDGQGLLLLSKRLERGRFVWPQASGGGVSLTPAQLSMLLEGIDWRMPARTHRPELAA